MKRRSIFGVLAAFGGAVAAAQKKPEAPLYKPDQCPHCGDMAEPYVRSIRGAKERVTRCKRCNVAFWQDATE